MHRPINRLIILFFISFVCPFIIGDFFGNKPFENLFFAIIIFVVIQLVLELLFQISFFLANGKRYIKKKDLSFNDLYIEPHPYLPFVYKKEFNGPKTQKFNYPLNPNSILPQLKSNNFRFFNGVNGDRDILIPKPKRLIRINCMGSSTTGNYISVNNKTYSYPIQLEEQLKTNFNNVEVNNCAMGGYNSVDMLVRFSLSVIDTEPDFLLLMPGYTDVKSYFTPSYDSDYSHSRKGLGEIYWKLLIRSKIPNFQLQYINYITSEWIPEFSMRNNVLDAISKGGFDDKINPEIGLQKYKRNIQSIIDISKSRDIDTVLCTYCMYMYDEIKEKKVHKLYNEIVTKENMVLKDLAKKNNLLLIDVANLMPKKSSNFVDSIHYSHKGMKTLANIISENLIKSFKNKFINE